MIDIKDIYLAYEARAAALTFRIKRGPRVVYFTIKTQTGITHRWDNLQAALMDLVSILDWDDCKIEIISVKKLDKDEEV